MRDSPRDQDASKTPGHLGAAAVSRRDFVGGGAGLAAWLGLGGGLANLLAACRASDETPDSTVTNGTGTPVDTAATSAATAAGSVEGVPGAIYSDVLGDLSPGGRVEIIVPEQVPDSLDQYRAALEASRDASDPAHDTIEAFDHNRELKPSLAKSVEIIDDTTLRYVLHEGITFHNGDPLTAESVKQTFEWIADPENATTKAGEIEGVSVEVEDEVTFVLRLAEPRAGIRASLTILPIFPVETADQQASEPLGAGPFLFKEWVRDGFVEYERNPDYWNGDAPPADTLRLNHFTDGTAGAQAFLAGQGDAVSFVPPPLVPDFQAREENGEFTTTVFESGVVYVGFNHNIEPYSDVRVRKAISLAVDRNEIAKLASAGLARPLYFLGLLPEDELYPAGLEYEQNLDEARALLAEAGYPDGFSGTFLTSDLDLLQGTAVVVQDQLKEIGIDLELEVVDLDTMISRQFETQEFEILVLGDAIHPEPTLFVDGLIRSDTGGNFSSYESEEANNLLRRGGSTLDVAERKKIYAEAFQKIFIDDVAILPVTTEPFMMAFRNSSNFDQYRPAPRKWKYPIVAKTL